MGAADIVPGVSGGTMAFILGVYEQLINAIKSFNLDADSIAAAISALLANYWSRCQFRFLLALGLGLASRRSCCCPVFSARTMDDPNGGKVLLFAFFFGSGAGVDPDDWA